MNYRCLFILVLFSFISHFVFAQKIIQGRVYSGATDSVITSASVHNLTTKQSAVANKFGAYRINASEGDLVIFSASGFLTDTVKVEFYMLLTPHDVTLPLKMTTLAGVNLLSSYKKDSLERRNDYADIFNNQKNITGGNRPTDGVGISVSPLSYFSKQAKQKRQLRKRLLQQEQDDYVDRSFPGGWVSKLTGLSGDSLNLFMYRYRPSYDFCRDTDRAGMTVYISEKLKEFRKPKGN